MKGIGNFIITFLTIAPAIPFVALSFKFILFHKQLNEIVALYSPSEWNFESKMALLMTISAIISIYLLIIVWFISISRLFIAPNPMINQSKDPELIIFSNRVLQNSIEQAIIFLPILSAWTINKCQIEDKNQVLLFTLIWLIGRILFILGYGMRFVHEKISTLRSFGFALNLFCNFILISRLIGYSII